MADEKFVPATQHLIVVTHDPASEVAGAAMLDAKSSFGCGYKKVMLFFVGPAVNGLLKNQQINMDLFGNNSENLQEVIEKGADAVGCVICLDRRALTEDVLAKGVRIGGMKDKHEFVRRAKTDITCY